MEPAGKLLNRGEGGDSGASCADVVHLCPHSLSPTDGRNSGVASVVSRGRAGTTFCWCVRYKLWRALNVPEHRATSSVRLRAVVGGRGCRYGFVQSERVFDGVPLHRPSEHETLIAVMSTRVSHLLRSIVTLTLVGTNLTCPLPPGQVAAKRRDAAIRSGASSKDAWGLRASLISGRTVPLAHFGRLRV